MDPSDGKCYGWPVFRHGTIYIPIKDTSFEQAMSIRQELKAKWDSIVAQLTKNSEAFGFDKVEEYQDQEPEAETREGPAILYPPILVSFRGIESQARTSVTVCVSPRHSKIWFRLSFLGSNGSTPSSSKLSQAEVKHFFTYAEDTAKKAVKIYIDTYNEVLQRRIGKTLLGVHTIRVKAIPSDLGQVATLLESGTFRMTSYFDTIKQLGSTRGLLNLTYGHDVSSRDEYEQLAKDYRWIAMNIRDDSDTVGLYSIHHYGDQTDFTGLVHRVSDDPHELSLAAQKFSKELLNDMAPRI
jgi:hypothetical protein